VFTAPSNSQTTLRSGLRAAAPAPSSLPSDPSAHISSIGTPRIPHPPAPIEVIDIPLPTLPRSLDGVRILHITDQHIRRGRPLTPVLRAAILAIETVTVDLVVLTGDFMTKKTDAASAVQSLRTLAQSWRRGANPPPAFAITGNHDSARFIHLARAASASGDLPIHFLGPKGHVHRVPGRDDSITLLGSSFPEDLMDIGLAIDPFNPGTFPLTLAHYPTEIFPAAALQLPLLLTGHTHGGQFRLSPRHLPHTSCDLPGRLGSGMLRLHNTLCCISRGLGTAMIDLRVLCPPQIPLYVLTRGPLPPLPPGGDPHRVVKVREW
jgi:predicted MPP superfamily phosphohydrolase